MTAAEIVKLGIGLSIFLIVFAVGLSARLEMAISFLKEPVLAARAMTAMFILVPAFTVFLYLVFPLAAPVPATLLALAVSPMPPILPKKELKAGGSMDYVVGLQVVASVVSIAAAAVIIPLVGRAVGKDLEFAGAAMSLVLLKTVGIPLVAGMLVNRFAPELAARLVRPAGLIGNIMLGIASLLLLYKFLPAVGAAIGDGTLIAISAMVAFGLLVGHLLGGRTPGNKSALAVATAARHPGVAIAIAMAVRPNAGPQIIATVLLYLLVSIVLTIPYMRWRAGKTG